MDSGRCAAYHILQPSSKSNAAWKASNMWIMATNATGHMLHKASTVEQTAPEEAL
jgi:hypothetical protein